MWSLCWGIPQGEIHLGPSAQYGPCALLKGSTAHVQLTGAAWRGWPSNATSDHTEWVHTKILNDRWMAAVEVANYLLKISREAIHNRQCYHSSCNMGSKASHRNTQVQMPIDFELLSELVRWLFETCHHWGWNINSENKHQSMEWTQIPSQVDRKLRMRPAVRAVMLTVFWVSQGPVLQHHHYRTQQSVLVIAVTGWSQTFEANIA